MTRADGCIPLAEKGAFAAAPDLAGPAGGVAREVASWPGVIAATHWRLGAPGTVDGADFYVGAEELGHIHLDGTVHLATTRAMRAALLRLGRAERFPWYASWVQTPIRTGAEARHALWLIRLNYDRLRGAGEAAILDRIAQPTTLYPAST